ncbi:hypothetical protein [Pseudomonas simiae]
MDYQQLSDQLNIHLSHLYSFARQMNELDFAASLSGEFRGMQDAGWSTPETAVQVFEELRALMQEARPLSQAQIRVILMLYCQLAEAGGAYETLTNIMRVVSSKPYNMWPFQNLVRVNHKLHRVIGPNANAVFRNLATTAKSIGLTGLASVFELAFRDDIRNGISHCDYIIAPDGLRLRNRNGGNPKLVSFKELEQTLGFGMFFFELFLTYNQASRLSFDPPKEIVGVFSENLPMPWTVGYNPETGSFSLSSSSPGAVHSPEYKRQTEINLRLGGRVLVSYTIEASERTAEIDGHIEKAGFEPHFISLDADQLTTLLEDVMRLELWDGRIEVGEHSDYLILSPWGYRWLRGPEDFCAMLNDPIVTIERA